MVAAGVEKEGIDRDSPWHLHVNCRRDLREFEPLDHGVFDGELGSRVGSAGWFGLSSLVVQTGRSGSCRHCLIGRSAALPSQTEQTEMNATGLDLTERSGRGFSLLSGTVASCE